jgi:hypothetical protein
LANEKGSLLYAYMAVSKTSWRRALMATPNERLELARQWSWMHQKVASGDWPSSEEVRIMAPLVYEWLRQAAAPPLDLPEEEEERLC